MTKAQRKAAWKTRRDELVTRRRKPRKQLLRDTLRRVMSECYVDKSEDFRLLAHYLDCQVFGL